MIKVRCFTNLDVLACEVWPDELPAVPNVGDNIESAHLWERPEAGISCHLRLRVTSVTYAAIDKRHVISFPGMQRYPRIELSIPSVYPSLREFYEWYARITGRSVHSFI